MHGRLKVRTSAEEAERKKAEQHEKVKQYRHAMGRILEKRNSQEFDKEMMSLTAVVLQRNPDIATLWNIRRECLLKLKESTTDDSESINEVFEKDLSLTEACLHVNPKSYCVFHHRCWLLENSDEPNWQREVNLCTKYLKLDERNFHVWDYRRYVAEKAKVSPEKELEFCTEKIQKNFSNYSSWHQRSKLLPILYPHETDQSRPINEKVLRDELELVLTAAFTDPNDSSAWFYQRWLLGNSEQDFDIAAFKLTKTYALLAFSRPVDLHKCALSLDAATKFDTHKWKPLNELKNFDTVWKLEDTFELNNESGLVFDMQFVDEHDQTHSLRVTKSNDGLFGIKTPKFGYEFGENVMKELNEQLSSCNQLLEFEPDSKWTLLTAALLMRAIDRKNYHVDSLKHLESLKKCDELRIGYYTDLGNKWSIEDRLADWIASLSSNTSAKLNLDDLNLVDIHYRQYFSVADQINLSANKFDDRRATAIKTFLGKCNVKFDI